MFGSKVKRRVMEVLNKKILDAQIAHDEKCVEIDEKAEKEKETHLDQMVQKFISKL